MILFCFQILTKDSVTVFVNAIMYYKVILTNSALIFIFGSLEFVFYQSGVLVEIKGKKQSRRSHFLVQNAFQVIDSSAVAELRKQTDLADRTGIIQFLLCYVAIFKSTTTRIIFVKLFGHPPRVHLIGLSPIVSPMEKEFSIEAPTQTPNPLRLLPRVPSCRSYLFVAYITFPLSQ